MGERDEEREEKSLYDFSKLCSHLAIQGMIKITTRAFPIFQMSGVNTDLKLTLVGNHVFSNTHLKKNLVYSSFPLKI